MDTENIYGKLLAEGGCNTVVPLMFDLDYCMKGAGGADGLRRRKACKRNVKGRRGRNGPCSGRSLMSWRNRPGGGTGGKSGR